MISICLIYSNERKPQALQTLEYLSYLPYKQHFDLIQVCDGQPNHLLPQCRQVIVPRIDHQFFCRANLWNAGIEAAKNDIITILDCDRIVHPQFFSATLHLQPGEVVFCSKLYQLLGPVALRDLVDNFSIANITLNARPDFRFCLTSGTLKPGKNPMSGCVSFWRPSYFEIGGLSKDFLGWGFNDTEFYVRSYFRGWKYIELPLREFHLYHEYEVPRRTLLAMNAWNAVQFYDLWSLPYPAEIWSLFEFLRVTPQFLRQLSLKQFIGVL